MATSQGKSAADGLRETGSAHGVGRLVEGGGPTPVQGSLNLSILGKSTTNGQGFSEKTEEDQGGGFASAQHGQGSYHFQWDQPAEAQARKLLAAPQPEIPQWVSKKGLSLNILISFILTSDGLLNDVSVEGSSGYSEVDIAVSEAVRHWRFSEDPSARPIHGLLPYAIRAR
jgi:TonB family protein